MASPRLSPVLWRIIQAILLLNLLSVCMLTFRILATGTYRHGYIPWNLALAWIPLILAIFLSGRLQAKSWHDWRTILLAVLWVGFLPNTWYVLSDFIHVYPTGELSQLFDITLIFTLVISGFALGFTSIYLVHRQLLKRLWNRDAHLVIGGVFLISSFAIYLGRDLRWNTWDVLANPAGLLLDVSDRIIDPLGHPRSLTVTGLFFVLICVFYTAIYRVIRPLESLKKH